MKEPKQERIRGGKTLLLVEDNPGDEALAIRALQQSDVAHHVIVARDGAEALDYLFCTGEHQERDPSEMPALVLLDLNMPKVDGIEVLRRIKADGRNRQVPVVVFTSSTQGKDVVSAYDLGANSYIEKPVNFDEFSAALKSVVRYWLVLNQASPPRVTGRQGHSG